MDGSAPDLFCRLQAIRSAHQDDYAVYWAITAIISQMIGADVERAVEQMEYWLKKRAEPTDAVQGWEAAR